MRSNKVERCQQCGTPTIPMDDTGRREYACECIQREEWPICGHCSELIDVNAVCEIDTVHGPMHPECYAAYMQDVKLGLDE